MSKAQSTQFLRFIKKDKWEEARQLLPAVKTSTPVSDTLKNLLNRSDVPPEMIRSLLIRLKELSKTKGFPTGLSSLMKMTTNKDLKEFCLEGSLSTLKAFLQEVSGTYQDTEGRDFTWPSVSMVWDLIHDMWDNYLRGTEPTWRRSTKAESERDLLKASSLTQLEQCPSLKLLWQKTEALLLAYSQRDQFEPSNAGNDWLVVHAIAQANCPVVIMWFALRLYPEQVRTRDHNGNLPLHYAASHSPPRSFWIDYREEELNVTADKVLVMYVLESFPEGAGYADAGGRLPLHRFLESYDPYTDYLKILSQLIKEYPEAVVTKDPKTRFHPFVQAAFCKIGCWEPVGKTDIVYTLLRKNPEVLMNMPLTKKEREYRMALKQNQTLKAVNAKLEEKVAQLESEKAANAVKIEELTRRFEQLKEEMDHPNAAGTKRDRRGTDCNASSEKRARSSSQ